jgi:hypothetical protein
MRLLFSISMLFLLFACNNSSKLSPIDYNNQVVNEQNKIIQGVLKYVDAISTNSADAEKIRLSLVEQCERSLKIAEAMDGYNGDTRLRDTAIDLFKFYLKISEGSFKEISEINSKGDEITVEDIERLQTLESEMDKKEAFLDNALVSAQDEFSKKYNFKLGENEFQKKVDDLNRELE